MKLELSIGGINLTGLTTELPNAGEGGLLIRTNPVYDEPTKPSNLISIRELQINDGSGPDMASIVAGESFPVQTVTTDVRVSALLLRTIMPQ